MALVDEGKLLHPKLQPTPPTPPISKAQLQTQRKLDKAARYYLKLDAYLSDLEDRGFTMVYVDGSSEKVLGVGFVGTYGIYCEGNLAISAYLHTHLRQTNNTTEIYAALQTLKLFPTGKVTVCTDSSLVQLGATGKAKKWALNNWVGSRGPLSNVELWKELLTELESPHYTVQWIKVPSYVGIQGNEEADSLAEDGRLNSLLLQQSVAPQARSLRLAP